MEITWKHYSAIKMLMVRKLGLETLTCEEYEAVIKDLVDILGL